MYVFHINVYMSASLFPLVNKMESSMGPQLPVVEEEVQIATESSNRNLRVVGGKKQKRKRQKQAKKKKKGEQLQPKIK